MPDKKAIFENVTQYPAEQLAEFIRMGVVTLEELSDPTNTYGMFDARKRLAIRDMLAAPAVDSEWEAVRSHPTLENLSQYFNDHPASPHLEECQRLYEELMLRKRQEQAQAPKVVEPQPLYDEWPDVDKTSAEALETYKKDHPDSSHIREVNRLLNEIYTSQIVVMDMEYIRERINEFEANAMLTPVQRENNIIALVLDMLEKRKINHVDLLDAIRDDHNFLSANVVKRLCDDGIISYADLMSIDIPRDFIERMARGVNRVPLPASGQLQQIDFPSTEMYFWGIPQSGKSCVLGAILSVARSGKVSKAMYENDRATGYGYMVRLANLFRENETGVLLQGTAIDEAHEMGFELVDEKDKYHPITCIDFPGELVKAIYKRKNGETLNVEEEQAFTTMENLLINNRTGNRKWHFFVVEYGADNRLYEGLAQSQYLSTTMTYLKGLGVFRKDTDAIFVIITKADKAHATSKEFFDEYLHSSEYSGFVQTLEHVCKTHEINGGALKKMAFTLGDVCFQNYCRFNAAPATNIVQLMISETKGFRKGRLGKFLDSLSR